MYGMHVGLALAAAALAGRSTSFRSLPDRVAAHETPAD